MVATANGGKKGGPRTGAKESPPKKAAKLKKAVGKSAVDRAARASKAADKTQKAKAARPGVDANADPKPENDERVRVLVSVETSTAAEFLRTAFKGGSLVQVIARSEIDYQGRAESRLPPGERIHFFKPDGTLLVHTAAKLKPVNWQPPGCSFQASVEGERLVLTAMREKPREIVRITLHDIQCILAADLDDEETLALSGSEDDIQAALAARPDVIEAGFSFWKRERDSGRGPMDLYGVDKEGRRVIVEVKRRAASVATVEQLRRYVERERGARGADARVRGILVAPTVSEKARKYLADLGLEYREIDVQKLLAQTPTDRAAGQRTLQFFG